MKGLMSVLLAALLMVSAPSIAHSDAKALHGGQVQVSHDMEFELVHSAELLTLYVRDHGKPLPSADLKARITVLSGGKKHESTMTSDGADALVATIAVTDKAVVIVQLEEDGHHPVTVRFSL
ncbi:hypothetical protein [Pseudidiomarina mangrovi]|uniref:hypothetical protein n=1 Tax=Pseudidiomarina mangrovi TaxID=2487133 RepID=UPI000FCC7DA8|nr:hypothetical protein [Pseudidiomarina mangrovi]